MYHVLQGIRFFSNNVNYKKFYHKIREALSPLGPIFPHKNGKFFPPGYAHVYRERNLGRNFFAKFSEVDVNRDEERSQLKFLEK